MILFVAVLGFVCAGGAAAQQSPAAGKRLAEGDGPDLVVMCAPT
jgi:hypothetical protein